MINRMIAWIWCLAWKFCKSIQLKCLMAGINRSRLSDVDRLAYYYLLWYTHVRVSYWFFKFSVPSLSSVATQCVSPQATTGLGVHIAKAVLESRVTRERITNDRKLPRCWMKWSMCVRVRELNCGRTSFPFFFVCKRLCFDLGCKSLHCHPRRPVKFIQGHPWISMDLAFLGWGAGRRVVCVLLACGAYLQRMNCRLTDYYWPILLQHVSQWP